MTLELVVEELQKLLGLVDVRPMPTLGDTVELYFSLSRTLYMTTANPKRSEESLQKMYPKQYALTAATVFQQATAQADDWLARTLARVAAERTAPGPCLAAALKTHFAATTPADQQTALDAIVTYLTPVSDGAHGLHDATVTYSWDESCGKDTGAATPGSSDSLTFFCRWFFIDHFWPDYPDERDFVKSLIHETLHRQNRVHFHFFGSELYAPPPAPDMTDPATVKVVQQYKDATLSDHLGSPDSFAAFARDVAKCP